MTVSVSRFRKAFPEFSNTSDELCEQKLAAAELRINDTLYGDNTVQGTMLLAAHLLSISPEGQGARLSKENSKTIYGDELERMRREVTMGAGRVA